MPEGGLWETPSVAFRDLVPPFMTGTNVVFRWSESSASFAERKATLALQREGDTWFLADPYWVFKSKFKSFGPLTISQVSSLLALYRSGTICSVMSTIGLLGSSSVWRFCPTFL